MYLSNCCGADIAYLEKTSEGVMGICSDCHEHCGAEDPDLHEQAGLVFSGVSEERKEWIGTREQWYEYERLSNLE